MRPGGTRTRAVVCTVLPVADAPACPRTVKAFILPRSSSPFYSVLLPSVLRQNLLLPQTGFAHAQLGDCCILTHAFPLSPCKACHTAYFDIMRIARSSLVRARNRRSYPCLLVSPCASSELANPAYTTAVQKKKRPTACRGVTALLLVRVSAWSTVTPCLEDPGDVDGQVWPVVS